MDPLALNEHKLCSDQVQALIIFLTYLNIAQMQNVIEAVSLCGRRFGGRCFGEFNLLVVMLNFHPHK